MKAREANLLRRKRREGQGGDKRRVCVMKASSRVALSSKGLTLITHVFASKVGPKMLAGQRHCFTAALIIYIFIQCQFSAHKSTPPTHTQTLYLLIDSSVVGENKSIKMR